MFTKNGHPVSADAGWLIGAAVLGSLALIFALLSPAYAPHVPLIRQPVLPLVCFLMLAGGFYFYLCGRLRAATGPAALIAVLIAGTFMRIAMLFSTPALEVDFHRYLWDGAVTAAGENPYALSPDEVRSGENVPPVLQKLAQHPRSTIARINHPQVRSIYPPLTQAAFALAFFIAPWQLWPWRLILLIADMATLLLLLSLLRKMELPALWAAVFWLNPLYVKEMFNSAHMDALIFPFLLGALLLLIRHRHLPAVALLALAVGVKVWPVMLLPLFLREIRWPRRQVVAAVSFGVIAALLLVPMLLTGWDPQAGLAAYARSWELNDAAFRIIYRFSEWLVVAFGAHPGHAQAASRWILAGLLVCWVLVVLRRKAATPQQLADQCLLIIAALFLLSPTQFPWYGMWLTPLLALSPRRPLLLLTVLLPLYYLWYYFDPRGKVDIFSNIIVWMEFAPVWLWLSYEWMRRLPVFQKQE